MLAAGALAVLGIVLTQDWVYYWLRGTSEVILIGASLWAVDRFLEGRNAQAFVLGVAASLDPAGVVALPRPLRPVAVVPGAGLSRPGRCVC